MEKVRVSSWQFYLLSFMYVLGTTFFLRPGGLIAIAKQDAWMVWIWTGAAGIGLVYLWIKLAEQYPQMTLVEICTAAAGKWVGGAIALLYIFLFIQVSGWVVRNLGDFMTATLMPRTPISVFHIMMLIVVCYAVTKGLEPIIRSNEILTPVIVFTFLIICLLMIPEWNTERIMPAFRMNLFKTIKETRNIIAFPYIEVIALMMVYPYVNKGKKKAMFLGVLVATFILCAVTLFMVGVLGPTRAAHGTSPLFLIVQEIRIGPLIEHLEASVTVVLLVAIFVKLSFTFYAAVLGLCQLFGIKDRFWIAAPLILIVSSLSLASENVVENIMWDSRYVFEYEMWHGIIFPLFFLGLTWFRKRRAQR
ncbi:GerAB/ArcD/ProY family transporter [Paenibacillus pinihumi]|uniref:GerAB/ArcD/ProY family transporter n=1 Tax=Paenibacillus pinihumi TaxID=669462 RepID=UPI00040FFC26|nr:endospore germination permease [Paenibacillus pinihumi]